jgi:hypothetical protein
MSVAGRWWRRHGFPLRTTVVSHHSRRCGGLCRRPAGTCAEGTVRFDAPRRCKQHHRITSVLTIRQMPPVDQPTPALCIGGPCGRFSGSVHMHRIGCECVRQSRPRRVSKVREFRARRPRWWRAGAGISSYIPSVVPAGRVEVQDGTSGQMPQPPQWVGGSSASYSPLRASGATGGRDPGVGATAERDAAALLPAVGVRRRLQHTTLRARTGHWGRQR